ncbi:MAG: phosphonate ABC transporter, permease protein PhnE, partial [Candidatus Cloacimonadales bacterium]|jgi:phosphonate transport system permease protein|nr:phosphonate ABC transporter, permease protein PhnE [Candidatus Cloacimonadales bacterium]
VCSSDLIGSIQYLVFKIQDIYAIYNLNSLLYSPLLTLIVSLFLFLLQLKTGERLKKRLLLILSIMAIVLTILVGFYIVEIQPVKFVLNFHKASNILKNLFAPNFSLFVPMLNALAQTIYLALMATVLAIPFAFFLSFFAARNLMSKRPIPNMVYYIVRTLSTFTRSIEAIVWAIIFTVWVGIGPFAGMLALMVHSIASLVKLYSEQIENIDHGPVEAMQATGAGTLQIWIFAVVPQILSPFLAFTIYRWDINIRMATIVGFVGGGGIGQALQQQQQLLKWSNVSIIMLMIAITVWVMDIMSAKLREYLMRK